MIPQAINPVSPPGMLRGLKIGLRTRPALAVHFFFSAVVLMAGLVLECSAVDWLFILLGLGAIIASELFHGAIEAIAKATKNREEAVCLSAAAMMVVMGSGGLACTIVIARRLIAFMS
jgi:diacylglycerol kinase